MSAESSIQVLAEFQSAATGKLRMRGQEAEQIIRDLRAWIIHKPGPSDVLASIAIQRRYRLSWWDAMIVNNAVQCGAEILWTEDLAPGQKVGSLVVSNPFRM